MAPEIIDDPRLMKTTRNVSDKAITVVGTGAVLYFLMMITLVVWYFAGLYFVDSVFSWRHVEDTFDILLKLIVVALVTTLVMLLWAEYNYRTFAHLNRRSEPLPVTESELASFFKTPAEFVTAAHQSKFLRLHTEGGNNFLCDVDMGCFEVRKIEGDPAKGFQSS